MQELILHHRGMLVYSIFCEDYPVGRPGGLSMIMRTDFSLTVANSVYYWQRLAHEQAEDGHNRDGHTGYSLKLYLKAM